MDEVVGSVGRYRDFDGEFLPTRRSMQVRWIEAEVTQVYEGKKRATSSAGLAAVDRETENILHSAAA